MFLGHFAVGVATKPLAPKLPVWLLFLAPQFMDVLFMPLVALGIEGYEPGPFGHDTLTAHYTHSLVGAVLISLAAYWLGTRVGKTTSSGLIVGGLSLSHWFIDLFVHHHDMPILPGNAGDLPLLGFGLWDYEYLVFGTEVAMAITAVTLYFRWANQTRPTPRWYLGPLIITTLFLLMILGDIGRLPPL